MSQHKTTYINYKWTSLQFISFEPLPTHCTCVHISLSLSLCGTGRFLPTLWACRADTAELHIYIYCCMMFYDVLCHCLLEASKDIQTIQRYPMCIVDSLRSSFSMVLCWWSILGKLWKRYSSRCIRIISQTPGHSPSGCRSKVVTATWSTQNGTCWSSRREPGAKAFPVISSGQAASPIWWL